MPTDEPLPLHGDDERLCSLNCFPRAAASIGERAMPSAAAAAHGIDDSDLLDKSAEAVAASVELVVVVVIVAPLSVVDGRVDVGRTLIFDTLDCIADRLGRPRIRSSDGAREWVLSPTDGSLPPPPNDDRELTTPPEGQAHDKSEK